MDVPPSCVVKVGGSLFGVPDLATRLINHLADFGRPRPLLVCGGGTPVDVLRRWDRIYNLGEEACHWLALRVLSVNAGVLERLLNGRAVLAGCPQDCEAAWSQGKVPVYDVYHFIADTDEETRDPLPRRWQVTSDSIAARMAVLFGAPELVLLKSVTVPERLTTGEAASAGFVDAYFPTASQGIERIVCINLRAEEPEESFLLAQ